MRFGTRYYVMAYFLFNLTFIKRARLGYSQEVIPKSSSESPPPPIHRPGSLLTSEHFESWMAVLHLCVYWSPGQKNHLSDSAILTLNDFHLAWSIHVFPPTQQPTAGKETLRQVGRHTGETLLPPQSEPLFTRNSLSFNLFFFFFCSFYGKWKER